MPRGRGRVRGRRPLALHTGLELRPGRHARTAREATGRKPVPARPDAALLPLPGGAQVTNGVLSVPFTNRVRIRKGLWRWTGQSFIWQVRKLPAGKTCDQWATRTQTFQVDGNKVFGGDRPDGRGRVAVRHQRARHVRSLRLERRQASRRGPRDRGRERPRREPPPLARRLQLTRLSLDRGTHLRPPAVDTRRWISNSP